MVPAAPLVSAASSSRNWRTLGTHGHWGPEHLGDQSTLGIQSTSRTGAPQRSHTVSRPPAHSTGSSQDRRGKLCWGMHQVCGLHTHSYLCSHGQAFRTAPFLPPYHQSAKKLPICCRDVAGRKSGRCLPVPGVRTGLQQLWSQRSWAQHQPGQALCSPGEGEQRQVSVHTTE